MKTWTLTLTMALIVITPPTTNAFACNSSADCKYGATCSKTWVNKPGVCTGGMQPGNSNDRNPPKPEHRNDTRGKTCQTSGDCSYGGACVKSGNNIYGVCSK